MENNEDYLDGLLDSITQAKSENKTRERTGRERNRSERRGRSISANDDFMEATGLNSYRRPDRNRRSVRATTEDDFLRSFEDELSMDDADELIRSFEMELNSPDEDDIFDIVDHSGRDRRRSKRRIFADDESDNLENELEESAGADAILDNIADIVSEAKNMTEEETIAPVAEGPKEEITLQETEDTPSDISITETEEEPDLSATDIDTDTSAKEVPLMDESGEDVELEDLLADGEDGELMDIGDLLDKDEEGEELEEAKETFDEAADGIASGGEGVEASEDKSGATGATDVEEADDEEKGPNIFAKIIGAITGIFKKKDDEEEEEESEESEEGELEEGTEEGGDDEDPEEKKKREKEEAKKKKKEEADAKKKAKAEAKKQKDAEKKAKADAKKAAKAAKPKKVKKKKPAVKQPKVPIPVLIVFILLAISVTASINILNNLFSYRTMASRVHKSYAKQDYMETYRTLAGRSDLEDEEKELRKKAKLMAYMETKDRQYKVFMESDIADETGISNYSVRTNYQMALDSLISAVYFYTKNEGKANELGISEEYDEYGKSLEKELAEKFGLTAGDAKDLYRNSTRKEYTTELQRILKEKGYEEVK